MFMSASTARSRPPAAPVNSLQGTSVQAVQRTSFFMSDTFPPVAQYLNRATYLLSQGRPAAMIGVYFPTSSMWYGDNDSNTSVLDIARQLMENQRDFDFVDDQALSSVLTLNKGTLQNLSGQSYRTIIIPSISVISKTSLVKLKEFATAGGKVIFIGAIPALVTDNNFLNALKPENPEWSMHEQSGKLTPLILETLPIPDLKIDKFLPQIKYIHRSWNDGDLYFILNESKEPLIFNVSLSGTGKVSEWDAFTGQKIPLKGAVLKKERINAQMKLQGWETKFILISK